MGKDSQRRGGYDFPLCGVMSADLQASRKCADANVAFSVRPHDLDCLRIMAKSGRVVSGTRYRELTRQTAIPHLLVAWRVEILNETVAAEIAALPADMQARFLRLAERIDLT